MRYRQFIEEAEKQREKLVSLINKKTNKAEGFLRITKNNGTTQYFIKNTSKEHNGVYLSKKDLAKAEAIVQRDYDKSIKQKAEKELKIIDRFLNSCSPDFIEDEYTKLIPARKELVQAQELPDDEYIKSWKTRFYTKNTYPFPEAEYYTSKGERVRSKSEVIIADRLSTFGIPYIYEMPVYHNGEWSYPDFTVLNKRTREEFIWEHFGLMDNPSYRKDALKKIQSYAEAGYYQGKNMITTFEEFSSPLSTRYIDLLIKQYLI